MPDLMRVNVRTLAEFYTESGDLAAVGNAMERMREGIRAHQSAQAAYAEGWEKEVEPGMYCGLVLMHNFVPDQLLIPFNAVLSDTDGKYVYVVGENGEAVKRSIKVRNYQDSVYSVVLEGLEEGEQIYVTDK